MEEGSAPHEHGKKWHRGDSAAQIRKLKL